MLIVRDPNTHTSIHTYIHVNACIVGRRETGALPISWDREEKKEKNEKEKRKFDSSEPNWSNWKCSFLFLRAEFHEMGPRNPCRLGVENSVEDSEAEKTFLNLFAERRRELECALGSSIISRQRRYGDRINICV